MAQPDQKKIVYRASKTTARAPSMDPNMKVPGYGGFIPGAVQVIEKNYYETSDRCFAKHHAGPSVDAISRAAQARRATRPMGSMRAAIAPPIDPPKFLPGCQIHIPQVRFTFECSEGTLAKTWGPRNPASNNNNTPSKLAPVAYSPAKERFRPRMDKYIGGYCGHLPRAEQQIEKSYARIARGVELGAFDLPTQTMDRTTAKDLYRPKERNASMHDYKLPGYSGYVPQTMYQFEKRYSQAVVDASQVTQELRQS
eukprot:TRINITY_DN21571_c0_g1_i1.p1 TRINITY_DN21571_c0_g1~~TRINITY_DN21571_c0_g1_i1.p1  ORF type:complete len:254 (+),score=48.96 TRINITY_DN21571_c0_g1_i1:194-955(+)